MQTAYSILAYNDHDVDFVESHSLGDILPHAKPDGVSWITCSGIDDRAAVSTLLEHFSLSSLLVDTIFSFGQQQLETEFDDCLLRDFELVHYGPNPEFHIRVCFVLGHNFLLVFEKTPSGMFDSTRRRIMGNHTRAQQHGADYLLYLLARTVLINYQQVLASFTEKFDAIEDTVIAHPNTEQVYGQILSLREELRPLYPYLVSLANLIDSLHDEESPLIQTETQAIFDRIIDRDAAELLESYERMRAWIVELIDIHRANINDSTNRIMKTLTVLSTIFLPLTFIAGVYGMNFQHMPELQHELGYPMVLALMASIAIGILLFLRVKRWL